MKKLVMVCALALIGTGAFAQFNKGRMLVGGAFNLGVTTSKTESGNTTQKNGTTTSVGISPNFGYFIMDNLAVGASLGLSTSTYKPANNNTFKYSNTDASIIPFVRYYLPQGIFFQGQVGAGSGKTKSENNNTTTTSKTGNFTWGVGAGYAYFLNDFVAVEPMLMYAGYNTTYKSANPEYTNKNAGLSVRVGFQIYLGARN